MSSSSLHEFAFFIDRSMITLDDNRQYLIINDSVLRNRLVNILRLKEGRQIILFSNTDIIQCIIHSRDKKAVRCAIMMNKPIEPVSPSIILALPLLHKDSLEEVIYMATVYGVSDIHLLITQKSKSGLYEKDIHRLEMISRAAREQSKQFYKPCIHEPVHLDHFLSTLTTKYHAYQTLWCDATGNPLLEYRLPKTSVTGSCIIVGPEGDFTPDEKQQLLTLFTPVSLTNCVLRARDAASLIMGVMRL